MRYGTRDHAFINLPPTDPNSEEEEKKQEVDTQHNAHALTTAEMEMPPRKQ